MKIKTLPRHVYEKIKAGEVIEDYSSVVSELIDNSIDAGATQITIVINWDKDKIIVKDNGCGMDEEDLKLCFLPHTTSKINEFEDIFKTNTIGFRGEALNSIAKVSQVKIFSNTGENGHYIIIENEEIIKEGIENMPKGTIVEVSNIFYNYPVRKKFISSKTKQNMAIKEIVKSKAIPYPEIEFKLQIDDEILINLPQSDIEGRVKDVTEIKTTQTFSSSNRDFSIKGIISDITETYSTSSRLYFYVNNRNINKKSFFGTLKNALSDLIPSNNYIGGAVFVYVKPEFIDPNIHPSKKDIKITNEQVILQNLYRELQGLFREKEESKTIVVEKQNNNRIEEIRKDNINQTGYQKEEPLFDEKTEKENFKYLGILFETYILAEINDQIFFIDFHATHERIRYEKLKNRIEKKQTVPLLSPQIIKLDEKKVLVAESNKENIKDLGFNIEVFSHDSIIVREIPAFYTLDQWREDIIKIIEILGEIGNISETNDKFLKMIACRGSYMSGDKINEYEAKTIIKKVINKEIPLTCPHGRPIFFTMKKEEIASRFLRN